MRNLVNRLWVFIFVLLLAACGGGGGSPGTVSGSGSGASTGTTSGTPTTPSVASPTLAVALTNSAGTVLTANAITSGSAFFAKATLLDGSGAAIPNALVSFSTDATIGTLAATTVLTDASGVGKTQISPASLTVKSATQLTAQATVKSQALTASLNYQTSAANVAIGAVTPSPSSITALQSSAVTSAVTVDGVVASAGQVSVSFSASCGSFSPSTVTTSSAGIAASTYQSDSTCSGSVSLTASASGATSGTGAINVAVAQAANILYDSASETSLVVSSASSGAKQSTLKFKVVDASGTGVQSKNVTFSLDLQSIGAGVTFNTGGALTNASQVVPTDGSGFASVIIQSGTLPTPLIVTASVSPTMFASSAGLVVTSGKASQNKFSLSIDALSIEDGYVKDAIPTKVSVIVADRQSNPVPVGTAVTFVASHGVIQGSCQTNANSTCFVIYTTSNAIPRPSNGRASILAYMDGEESFTDLNGNNIWDAGEPFFDMGTVYRDDNLNGTSDSGEQIYPGGMVGSVSCASNPNAYPSVINTCDGVWSSSIRVRRSGSISLASPPTLDSITLFGLAAVSGFDVRISDSVFPANAMPTGTTVSAAVGSTSAGCSVVTVSPAKVAGSALATTHTIQLNSDPGCSGARIDVSVTTPGGVKITKPIFMP